MICPWCNKEQPEEIFQNHHKNHIHTDDTPENVIRICYVCHQRHHRESGYDTIIVKRGAYVKPTLEDEFEEITHKKILELYERYYVKSIAEKRLEEHLGELKTGASWGIIS